MKLPGTPATMDEGNPDTRRLLAASAWTAIACVPVIETVAVSVAVSDCVPAVLRVAVKVCVPPSAALKV